MSALTGLWVEWFGLWPMELRENIPLLRGEEERLKVPDARGDREKVPEARGDELPLEYGLLVLDSESLG